MPLRTEIAGLRLLAENAGAATRLEALRILPLGPESHRWDASGSIEELITSEFVESLREAEDYPPQPFTDRLIFDRTLTVIPGPRDDSVYVTRMFLQALFFNSALPLDVRSDLEELVGLALHVVDGITKRVGLGPFVAPSPPGEILVPELEFRRELGAALVLTATDLRSIASGSRGQLDRLARTSLAPVERHKADWLVTAPDLMLTALVEALTSFLDDRGLLGDFQDRYDHVVFANAMTSLARLGLELKEAPRTTKGQVVRQAILQADDGVRLVVVQLMSSLDSQPSRDAEGLPLREAPRVASMWDLGPDDVVLMLAQPVCDPYFTAKSQPAGPWTLALSAADLESLSFLMDGDDRILPRFVRAANRVRQDVDLIRCSALDEFRVWVENGESYWRPDSDSAVVMMIHPGTALPMRMAVAEGRSVMGVPWPAGGTVECTRRYFGDDIPIYVPPAQALFVGRAVLIGSNVAWVLIQAPAGRALPEHSWLLDATTLVDAAAYWLWQLAPHLSFPTSEQDIPLVFDVELPAGGLGQLFAAGVPAEAVAFVVEQPATVRLAFPRPIQDLGESNSGDVALLRAIYTGVCHLAGAEVEPTKLAEVVDSVADSPLKRRLVPIDLGWNSSIAQADTPRLRRVSSADLEDWRERAGKMLLERGWGPGPIAERASRSGVFRELVAGLFGHLENFVASAGAGLLATLIAQSEAAYRLQAIARIEYPISAACFGAHSRVAAESAHDLLAVDHPSQALRFLIEYTVAIPPSGSNLLSSAELDSLISLAALIMDLGLASDGVHFVAPDAPMEISKTGRLVYDSNLASAMRAFGQNAWSHALRSSVDRFGEHWIPTEPDVAEVPADLPFTGDAAFQVEFGFTLSELARFINAALLIADDLDQSVVSVGRERFVAGANERLGWGTERVSNVLKSLTLTPRSKFLAPAPPATPIDTYPWRHNRALSYLRRPFLEVQNGGESTIAYGSRHLAGVPRYLFNLVASGRLRASSPEMQELQGRMAAEDARLFVQDVAERCRLAGLEARVSVKKLDGTRIAGPKGDLGDIDVLAIDRSRSNVWLLECKSVQAAKTPWELHGEIRAFMKPGGFIDRHHRRREWMLANRELVARALNLREDFAVGAAIVTPISLLASALRSSRVRVLDVEALESFLAGSASE